MTRTRRGFSLVEMLVMMGISVLIIGVLYMMWDSSRRQERNVSRHMDVQRGLRGSMILIQKDLRELLEVIDLDREPNATLKSLSIKIPGAKIDETASVIYGFEKTPGAGTAVLRRNGRVLFQDSLTDFQIYPFTIEERLREVKLASEIDRIQLFKVKLSFLPGKDEFQRVAEIRSFSFTIYPRFANAKRKAFLSRFNLLSGRFAPYQQAPTTPLPDPVSEEEPVTE